MGLIANIVCKTVGVAGMSAVAYDAYTIGKKQSARTKEEVSADRFEHIVADSMTSTTENPVSGAIQNKVVNLRMNNPIVPFFGKIKGFCLGVLNSLGSNIIPLAFSALALAAKGTAAKVGAWGVAGCGLYTVIREGFGVGKESPIDN